MGERIHARAAPSDPAHTTAIPAGPKAIPDTRVSTPANRSTFGVVAHAPSLREMIGGLVATPSVSCVDPALDVGNRAVVDLLAGWLDDRGFDVVVTSVDGNANKANMVATLGRGESGLMLAGHADTVPYDAARWRHDPFALTEADGRWYGLGTSDMKSFFAIALEAIRDIDASDLVRPLVVVATADEETTMAGARALVEHGIGGVRHAVIGEPTALRPVRLHKGLTMEAVRVTGRAGHSSDPSLGRSALEGMHAVMSEVLDFRAELQRRHHDARFAVPVPTINLGAIRGGDNPNRICGDCELLLDVRVLPGMDLDAVRLELRDRVARALLGRDLSHVVESLIPGVGALDTDCAAPIVSAVEQLTGAQAGSVAFGTEGPHFAKLGIESVVIGPGDVAQAHQPDEHLVVERVEPMLSLLRGLVHRFCTAPGSDDA